MARTDHFRDMSELRQELQRLDAERQASGERMERYWQALQDREVRGRLISDAVSDALHTWKPLNIVSSLFGGGSLSTSLGTAFTRGRGWSGKIFWFLLSMALPRLLERAKDLNMEEIGQHLRATMDKISSYFAQRREQRTHAEHDD
jgi:hypothetical protein